MSDRNSDIDFRLFCDAGAAEPHFGRRRASLQKRIAEWADRGTIIAEWKSRLTPYPAAMKRATR